MVDTGQDDSLETIWGLIEKVWEQSGAWPEFTQVMRLALESKEGGERNPSVWGRLPGLCCQAAGGDPSWADPVAAAWLLFYAAAHLMDSLEDHDPPDAWWAEGGPALALNAFTGLFFSAMLVLQEPAGGPIARRAAGNVVQEVLHPLMRMSSGQYADFTCPLPTLAEYWRIAAAKSGAFFALACRAGARMATRRRAGLEGFEQFGLHLGLMIQVLDDLADYRDLAAGRPVDALSLKRSLPGTYIREVCALPVWKRFEALAAAVQSQPAAAGDLAALIEANGGVLYLLAELEIHRQNALRGLKLARATPPAAGRLVSLLDGLSAGLPTGQ